MTDLEPQQDQKPKRKGNGRQKIEIKKIAKTSNRQVTFSKRKKVIFEKASQISTLCGADIAIITFSEKGKPYAFGYPSPEFLTDRFLNINNEGQNCSNFNFPDTGVKEGEQGMINVENEPCLWELDIENMGLEEFDGYMKALYEIKHDVMRRINQLMMIDSNAELFSTCNPVPVADDDQNCVNVQNEGSCSRADDQIQNEGFSTFDDDQFHIDWFDTCFGDNIFNNNNKEGPTF